MDGKEATCQFHAGGQHGPQTLKRLEETKHQGELSGFEPPTVQWASV